MGLQRFSISEIEGRIQATDWALREARDTGCLAEAVRLESEEEELWKAWHRARTNHGFARV